MTLSQDELIQAELDWTIDQLLENQNEDAQTESTTVAADQTVEESPTEPVATEQVEEQTQPETKPEPTTQNKTDSVVKLLKQRNEARAEVERLQAQVKDTTSLEVRLKELEESIATQALEKEEAELKTKFYEATPNAKGHEAGIEKIRAEKWLSYTEAFQLYAAQTDPRLLLDEQAKNKTNTTLTWVSVVSTYDKSNPTIDDLSKMSDDDFLAWSNGKAKADRIARGYTN